MLGRCVLPQVPSLVTASGGTRNDLIQVAAQCRSCVGPDCNPSVSETRRQSLLKIGGHLASQTGRKLVGLLHRVVIGGKVKLIAHVPCAEHRVVGEVPHGMVASHLRGTSQRRVRDLRDDRHEEGCQGSQNPAVSERLSEAVHRPPLRNGPPQSRRVTVRIRRGSAEHLLTLGRRAPAARDPSVNSVPCPFWFETPLLW